ncbi:MAG: single-stranded DNA-binding protein [Pirellulales bacterium]|nr:single-stranded DNA-binding protein [Pirellulales bacterium]
MSDYNRVILMGRLTRDPDLRYTPNGTAVAEFGLAVNDRRKDSQSGEWIEDTQFIDITMWARQAEIAAEYLAKGSPIFLEGRLKFDSWEKEGQKHSKLRVVAERMQFIGPRGERSGQAAGGQPRAAQVPGDAQAGGGSPAAVPAEAHAGQPPRDDIPF